ncbi:MAG: hypothetical protein H6567_05040 [Lewinellaceae bacterium]|nr:hypothetical protein [Lewinellaceae bacterium]
MGLFDRFRKGHKDNINQNPEIKITAIDHGSHGDNIGGLIGFNNLNNEKGRAFVNELMAYSMTINSEMSSNKFEIKKVPISSNSNLNIRILTNKRNVLSAFPYLKTSYKLPFSTKEIIEWTHVNNCEAEIIGGGRDTFGLDFFATDYAINKSQYQQNKNFELSLSAVAFVVDKNESDQNTEVAFSEDFVAYIPSSNIQRQTYYDFIGKVIDFEEVSINNLNTGYIARVKLINDDSDPNFLTVDMFMNKENMRINSLDKGMKISGLLWFQGEIASE